LADVTAIKISALRRSLAFNLEVEMFRSVLLWMLGVPIPIIILLALWR
jgi:hypothetical protein